MIYLDHASNTYVFPEVLEAMLPWFQPERVGNPGSIHTQGVNARKAIEKARGQVARMIGADPAEVFFTSGGTESNNTWLRCLTQSSDYDSVILTTSIEHHSVLGPIESSTSPCFRIKYVSVHPDGSVDLDDLERLLHVNSGRVAGVSIMWVNNELGTVNPIDEIGALCKKYGALFHTDAVQAAGHIAIDVHKCGVDFLSLSGHKFGAPPGVGALYISSSVRKRPLIVGGGQERGMRGGTENVPGIVGMGEAAEIVTRRLPRSRRLWRSCRAAFLNELGDRMPGEFKVNGRPENCDSNMISLTIPGVNSEALLLLLDQQGIRISAGSACSAGSSEPSHVLKGVGISDEDAASTVRISMGFEPSGTDMVQAAKAIADAAHRLRSMYQ